MSNANSIWFSFAFGVNDDDNIKVGSHVYSEGDIYCNRGGTMSFGGTINGGVNDKIGTYQKWHRWNGTSRWADTFYTARDFDSGLQFEFNTLEELIADINRDGWEATVNYYAG